MIKSRICEMLGIKYPVFQGGLGLISSINAGTEAVRSEKRFRREMFAKLS